MSDLYNKHKHMLHSNNFLKYLKVLKFWKDNNFAVVKLHLLCVYYLYNKLQSFKYKILRLILKKSVILIQFVAKNRNNKLLRTKQRHKNAYLPILLYSVNGVVKSLAY